MTSRSSQPAEAARTDVELPLASPTALIVLAWLVPGLGHFLLGRRLRGLAFAVLILGSLIFGASLHGNLPWVFAGSPLLILATFGAMGSGAVYFALHVAGYTGDPAAWGYDYGAAFILSAGLMNLLLLLDVHDLCWGKELVDPEVADGLRAADDREAAEPADDAVGDRSQDA